MDFFLPQLLNDLIGEADAMALEILDELQNASPDISRYLAANSEERYQFENKRFWRFGLMFETFTDKYDNAARVEALLRAVDRGETGFVLWLRGFSHRQEFYTDMTAGHETDLEEYSMRFELATKLTPVPLVLVRNPATSESLLAQFPGADAARENTFPIDLDADWESDVRTLVEAASFIVVRNKASSPGLRTEIGILQDLHRLEATYFSDPEDAKDLLQLGKVNALNDAAILNMRSSAKGRRGPPASLSSPTRLWLQANRRERVRENVLFIFDLFNTWADRGQRMPRDIQAQLLASAIAGSIGLERLDLLVMCLASYAQIMASYQDQELPDRIIIANKYISLVNALLLAIDQVETQPPLFECADLPRLKRLMSDSEDPAHLTRKTTEIVRLMPGRNSPGRF